MNINKENMESNINRLPLEILEIIFWRLDNNSLLKLSQTSKTFYKQIIKNLNIHKRFVLTINYFASWNSSATQTSAINKSKRKFKQIKVIGLKTSNDRTHFSELIKGFYRSVIQLSLTHCEISLSAQVALFKLMPNLEVLQLYHNFFQLDQVAVELPKFLKLKELKGDISFHNQNVYQKARTLVHLEGNFSDLSFIWTQKDLKILIMRVYEFDENFMFEDNIPEKIEFELDELSIGTAVGMDLRRFSKILKSQPKLKKLDILDSLHLSNFDLVEIFSMKNLQQLSFTMKEKEILDPTLFNDSHRLLQLELKRWTASLEILEEFVQKFKYLKTLIIYMECDNESGCSLRELVHLDVISIFVNEHRSTIVKHFELPNLKHLSVGTLSIDEWQLLVQNNPNIINLVITTHIVPMDVLNCIVNLKILATLEINAEQNPSELDAESIKLILKHCNCLTNLTVRNLIGFEFDYKDVLQEFKEKLKFIKCNLDYSNFARVRKSRKPKFLIF